MGSPVIAYSCIRITIRYSKRHRWAPSRCWVARWPSKESSRKSMDQNLSATPPPREMSPARLEAFSDGVLAVIITIMVLELRPPSGDSLLALEGLIPGLLIYVLSFVFIGNYWNNHHHLLRATRRISGGVMWANLHLLFWLSLVPLVTTWVADHHLS